MGGMIDAIEQGFPQREIAESAYRFQRAVDTRDQIIVGVNDYVEDEEPPLRTLYIDETAAEGQLARLEATRTRRDAGRVSRALDELKRAAAGTANLMPPILEAVRAYATIGEMCDALRQVWGEYEESPVL
jgi:methylmalonyl-CoA mutase N-terminal domain/subunit